MELFAAALALRVVNAVLWLLVVVRILRHDRPVSALTRKLISLVLLFGMGILVLGALVPFGFPGELARLIYTAFTAFAGLIALGIITTSDAP